jgi:hypothetical protein
MCKERYNLFVERGAERKPDPLLKNQKKENFFIKILYMKRVMDAIEDLSLKMIEQKHTGKGRK